MAVSGTKNRDASCQFGWFDGLNDLFDLIDFADDDDFQIYAHYMEDYNGNPDVFITGTGSAAKFLDLGFDGLKLELSREKASISTALDFGVTKIDVSGSADSDGWEMK